MIENIGTAAYFAFEMLGTLEALNPKLMKVKKSRYVPVNISSESSSHLTTKSSMLIMKTTLMKRALPAFPRP